MRYSQLSAGAPGSVAKYQLGTSGTAMGTSTLQSLPTQEASCPSFLQSPLAFGAWHELSQCWRSQPLHLWLEVSIRALPLLLSAGCIPMPSPSVRGACRHWRQPQRLRRAVLWNVQPLGSRPVCPWGSQQQQAEPKPRPSSSSNSSSSSSRASSSNSSSSSSSSSSNSSSSSRQASSNSQGASSRPSPCTLPLQHALLSRLECLWPTMGWAMLASLSTCLLTTLPCTPPTRTPHTTRLPPWTRKPPPQLATPLHPHLATPLG